MFQSLKGILVHFNYLFLFRSRLKLLFKSLKGILVHFNRMECTVPPDGNSRFQSLKGILVHFNIKKCKDAWIVCRFQSLKGILVHFNRRWLEPLLYLIFKVQIREPQLIYHFQEGTSQYPLHKNSLKPSTDKVFGISENLIGRNFSSTPYQTRNTAPKTAMSKKTPTASRINDCEASFSPSPPSLII